MKEMVAGPEAAEKRVMQRAHARVDRRVVGLATPRDWVV